ncbi:MAG: 50S ribosomal protein L5 [Candidatus Heimdallarchaeota archaeon]
MRIPKVEKVIVNFAVGQSGIPLEKAKKVCEQLTQQKPVESKAKQTIREFGIRKGEPIACKTTLRGHQAEVFLEKALQAKDKTLSKKNFDIYGNFSFGIKEHINLPGTRYDPDIGVLGFEVCVTMERSGYRIKRRRHQPKKIPTTHKLTKEEVIRFITKKYDITLE